MKKEQANKLIAEIESMPLNVKAEVVVANLQNSGCLPSEIIIQNEGCFKRPYRNDILKINAKENEIDEFSLFFSLTRNGIYDLLPEGFTHRPETSTSNKSGKSFAVHYKNRKNETAQARKFFKPIENAIFHQLVRLEKKEQELFYEAKAAFYEFLIGFWRIKRMRQPYESILIKLMPHLNFLAGNYALLCKILEKILNVPVCFNIQHRTLKCQLPVEETKNLKLGQNFTAGSYIYGVPFIVFTIGTIPHARIKDFLQGGDAYQFLQEFYRYTIPFDIEVESEIISERYIKTENDMGFGILGYSSGI